MSRRLTLLRRLRRGRLSEGGTVGDLIARLGRDGRPDTVRDALRAALRDPTLDVLFWVPGRGAFVDAQGEPGGPVGDGRTVTTVRRHGRTVAKLVHAPIAAADARAADAIVAAAGLALENAQLQAELRAQLQELRASERRLASVLENVHLVAVSIDWDGAITFANRFFCDLVGWSHEELIGRSWVQTFNDGDQEFIERMRAGTIFAHEESQLRTRAGAQRDMFWSNTLSRGADGRIIGATSIGEDVTERKRAERELRQLAREQAALRRVATLVAEGTDPTHVFRSVVEEVCGLLGGHGAGLTRFEEDGTRIRVLAATGPLADRRGLVGSLLPVEPGTLMAGIRATRRPVRLDSYEGVAGPIAE
jgi:PAS domain S-box-containing protein